MLFIVRSILVAGVLAVSGTAAPAQTRPDRPETPEVRTAATVQRSVQPELATVTLQFTGEGATPAQAGSRLASRADSLRRALATLGIPRDSLVNRSRWYWWRERIEVIAGPVKFAPRSTPGAYPRFNYPVQDTTYRAHDAIEVRTHDVSRVGAVLDTALGRGITDISEVRFTASDVSAPQVEALREATVRARKQAEAIAAAGACSSGASCLSIRKPITPVATGGTISRCAVSRYPRPERSATGLPPSWSSPRCRCPSRCTAGGS